MKKNYALIDIFKFTFAIVVVFIHTCSERYQNGLTTILTSMAVPYFFVASGFFLNKKLRKTENKKEIIISYMVKIFKMYLFFSIVMWLIELPEMMVSDNILITVLKRIRIFLFIGDYHLWYLLFTIYAVIILYCANKVKINNKVMLIISFILYFIGYWILNYEGTSKILEILKNIHFVILGERNGLTTALLFMYLGVWIEEYDIGKKRSFVFFIKVMITSILLLLVNRLDYRILSIMLVIYLISNIFVLFLKINVKSRNIYTKLRQYSTMIYLVHIPVALLLCKIVRIQYSNDKNILFFIIVTVISLIISIGINFFEIKRKEKKYDTNHK